MRSYHTYCLCNILCIALSMGIPAYAVEGPDKKSESPTAPQPAPAPAVVPADSGAEQLDELRRRVDDLTGELAAASITIGRLSSTNRLSRLRSIERKAFEYDALSVKIAIRDRMIAGLEADLADASAVVVRQALEIAALSARTNELSKYVARLESEQAPLRKALSLIRLGRYEYYEIKKGDTCESIAGQATIYGDTSKHVLIRQANRESVVDLDNLTAGEMLIIPRFSLSGRYEL